MHLKFEELYDHLLIKILVVSERILTLGFSTAHNYSHYQKVSSIKESKKVADGRVAVAGIMVALRVVIILQRNMPAYSGNAGSEGTNTFMSDIIRSDQKKGWLYSDCLATQQKQGFMFYCCTNHFYKKTRK